MADDILASFTRQAGFCRMMGSPLTAAVLDALAAVLDDRSATGRRVLAWASDPTRDALPLRLAGALHALARSGRDPALSAAYVAVAEGDVDWPGLLARVVTEWDDWLLPWLNSPPQTNEVGRSGALWPAVMAVTAQFGPRVELLELGASGGLNLNMDRFHYDLGGEVSGPPESPLHLAPQWQGPAPVIAPVEVVARAGVDLQPLDMTDAEVAGRMLAYIWPDQTQRAANAEAAIAIAQRYPPPVVQGDGVTWLAERLAAPQAAGVTRIVYHSIALVYFPDAAQAGVTRLIEAAGAAADAEHPLAWISLEHMGNSGVPDLTLRVWPGDGVPVLLARAHPHGTRVMWNGEEGAPVG